MALAVVVLTMLVPIHHLNCETERNTIADWRIKTNYMMDVMGQSQFPVSKRRYACSTLKHKGFIHALWASRYRKARAAFTHPPHYEQWLCIHSGEADWNDPNAPYYGGLQMDYGFMSTYGPHLLNTKGTADHWTPLEQMWVAEHAYASGRGFYPWPNTARACGLI